MYKTQVDLTCEVIAYNKSVTLGYIVILHV